MATGLPGLRNARREAALSQRELAELADVTYATIARLELAQTDARPSTVRKLAAALHVKPRDLMRRPPADDVNGTT
jgi:predicted transcriptional regulator